MMMEKTFDPKTLESALYQTWEQAGYFKPTGSGQTYGIPLPPPNVTGSLHMGHGFQDILMDTLIRYHRMQGDRTLWQPGTDHAGIATQLVVEKQLEKAGTSREALGREAFVKRVWEWKEESGGNILRQMQRLGASCDFERARFSMDESLSEATQKVFIQLYEEGLIYQGTRLVNWDVALQTAVSDLEVNSEEEAGSLWHIRYPIVGETEALTIATTRPETLLGDVAVAVNPQDARYRHLIGKAVVLPLCNRHIPIIADDYVDVEFGTGCVKITPAHDFNDYEVGQRHHLTPINILNDDGTLNSNVPEAYQSLERFAARKQILKDLEAQGFLVKTEPHKLKVPRGERSGQIIEPKLSKQWYVRIKPLAEPAVEAVKSGKIRFIPENAANLYYRWMEDIQDWCISRQLWWGHRIPAWYDDTGNCYVGESEAAVRGKYHLANDLALTQDHDVLDTWFTAALWPFASLGWPAKTQDLQEFYPHNVLVTGFDIIFFWVARMIMFGLKFMGDVPFREVYIHGLIRDHEGQKMSKSKGNVLDPIDLIDGIDLESLVRKRTSGMMLPKLAAKVEQVTRKTFPNGIAAYGCDALRFTFAALASTSRDINFTVERLEGYRNFCNKLWNAARFTMMQLEQHHYDPKAPREYSPMDQWITDSLQQTVNQLQRALADYRFDHFAQTLYEFVWNHFCDWYLELAKVTLQSDNPALVQGTLHTLVTVLETILRMAHPLIPFITESIWQALKPYHQSSAAHLMMAPYPTVKAVCADHSDITWLQTFITHIRSLRSEMNVSPAKMVAIWLYGLSTKQQAIVERFKPWLLTLAKIDELKPLASTENLPATAAKLMDAIEIYLPLAGLIDLVAEKARLEKELGKLEQTTMQLTQKLSNASFVDKAPEAVVAKTKEQLAIATEQRQVIEQQIAKLTKI